jgi:hypothetical protein
LTLEVRYIMFAPEEMRRAIIAFVLKEGYTDTPDDIVAMNINSDVRDALSVDVQVRRAKTIKAMNISSEHLVGAMLLYCRARCRVVLRRRSNVRAMASHWY